MAKADLKLLKLTKHGTKPLPKLSGEARYTLHITRSPKLKPDLTNALPDLTPAEHAEADRFRALTLERAARQARVRRLILILRQRDRRVAGVA
jgi:hypothetical protein